LGPANGSFGRYPRLTRSRNSLNIDPFFFNFSILNPRVPATADQCALEKVATQVLLTEIFVCGPGMTSKLLPSNNKLCG